MMQKNKKNTNLKVLYFILGAVIFSTGTAFAFSILAPDVGYTPSDSTWKQASGEDITDVKEALDNLHFELKERKIYCVRLTGDKKTLGSRYGCNLGDGNINYLYILKVGSNTKMLMEKNIVEAATWYTAMDYLTTGAGKNLKTTWSNAQDVDLPEALDIAAAVGYTSWDLNTATRTNDFCFGNVSSRTCVSQGSTAYATQAREYNYLFDYTQACGSFGCIHSNSSGNYGYWTKDEDHVDNAWAWYVDRKGALTEDYPKTHSSYFGVRLVVTMKDYNLSE